MPAIIIGTVVEWEVVAEREVLPEQEVKKRGEGAEDVVIVVVKECCPKEPRVKNSKDIPIYVANENTEASTVVPAIIAKYILDREDADQKRLLQEAEKGLLQVVKTTRTPITPPSTFGAISS